MVKNESSPLGAEEEDRYQALADWAESDMSAVLGSGMPLRGADAAAAGRVILIASGMDPAELDRISEGHPYEG
ncbi:hypothetical protein SAMN04489740_4148 [Arthrobacter alpinus]|uniref:Uncharacterized protein n=1 Tax=Arthrobacter alpinus TaxID=656366 RepID=A0A1H5PDG4_9MICC|nr:hypothetical protein [Arthrobacter alpinus]SEF11836.1 hypothetical protein SAMN04489740_4148 [Arthrobacter alpinus]